MPANILVVEDEPAIQELVAFACGTVGFDVRRADCVAAAEGEMRSALPHLVILDWMLPDRPGVELLRRMRGDDRTRAVPVIMLTARSAEEDRVIGLDAGADDYLSKPFSPRELLARVRAVLRRSGADDGPDEVTQGPLAIDSRRHEVRVSGRAVKMGLPEFRLLRFLAANPDRVFSRRMLLQQVWTDPASIEEQTVDVTVLRIRRALGTAGAAALVGTVRGVGYRFVPAAGIGSAAAPDTTEPAAPADSGAALAAAGAQPPRA
jgi:two-component system phosphate regulon response regulator PhoB